MNELKEKVGVIGAGSFGTAVANLLAENSKVILLVRSQESFDKITQTGIAAGQNLSNNIEVTLSNEYLAHNCDVIFPIIPGQDFKKGMQSSAPFLTENHILIHGTKGLEFPLDAEAAVGKDDVITMSKLIEKYTPVTKIGCLAGPNLAKEIAQEKPAATVIAGTHPDVMQVGKKLLRSPRFQVLTSDDLLGVELCGVLKNIMAIASGMASGLEIGENAKALLINRSLIEMIHIGQQMGATIKPFLGVAGMGDLIATCSSPTSRNFTFGYRMAKGASFQEVMQSMEETAEGVRTTKIIYQLSSRYEWKTPITKLVYHILFEEMQPQLAVNSLMKLTVEEDVNFL